jgi:hypothetical protein
MRTFSLAALSVACLAMAAATQAAAGVTTFATVTATGGANFDYKNASPTNTSASASLFTLSTPSDTAYGSVGVNFSYINITPLYDSVVSNIPALFRFNATATDQPSQFLGGYATGHTIEQDNVSGSFTILSEAPITLGGRTYAAGSNLLSGVFDNASVTSKIGYSSGSITASSVGGTLTYSSDFLVFDAPHETDFAIGLTAITPGIASTDPASSGSVNPYGLNAFTAVAGDQLSADPAPTPNPVPEPASWALTLTGLGALGGALRARRRAVALSA